MWLTPIDYYGDYLRGEVRSGMAMRECGVHLHRLPYYTNQVRVSLRQLKLNKRIF